MVDHATVFVCTKAVLFERFLHQCRYLFTIDRSGDDDILDGPSDEGQSLMKRFDVDAALDALGSLREEGESVS